MQDMNCGAFTTLYSTHCAEFNGLRYLHIARALPTRWEGFLGCMFRAACAQNTEYEVFSMKLAVKIVDYIGSL